MKINYLATYTTILKKQDRDYYWGVIFARIAETSEANNNHHASYPSPPGRAIDTGVECAEQRLTAVVSLLLISQCAWQRSTKGGPASPRYKPSKP